MRIVVKTTTGETSEVWEFEGEFGEVIEAVRAWKSCEEVSSDTSFDYQRLMENYGGKS